MAVDAVAQKHRARLGKSIGFCMSILHRRVSLLAIDQDSGWQQAIRLLEAAKLLQRSDSITLNTCLTAAARISVEHVATAGSQALSAVG